MCRCAEYLEDRDGLKIHVLCSDGRVGMNIPLIHSFRNNTECTLEYPKYCKHKFMADTHALLVK